MTFVKAITFTIYRPDGHKRIVVGIIRYCTTKDNLLHGSPLCCSKVVKLHKIIQGHDLDVTGLNMGSAQPNMEIFYSA